ncbi:MAG: GFA family protein [Bdellovibrionales bacterium]|nr:GFA family protein [Bdellovibrionales bacterium]
MSTMNNTKSAKGSCLCGKVEIHASTMKTDLGVCHCGMCRKWSAGPFLAVDCGTEVKIEGINNVGIYSSSDWAERAFCKNCGTNLFYRLKENQQHIVSSELFNEPELNFDHQIFIDEKPSYYSFSNETKNMTGAEVFAAFAPKD